MDCLEARRKAATDEQAASHMATCKMCNAVLAHPEVEMALRAAAAALVAPANMPDPWPRLQSLLVAERGPRAWLRSLPRGWVATTGFVLSLMVILAVDLSARGPHWDRWPLWHQLATLIGGSALLGGGLAQGLRSVFDAPTKAELWATGALAIGAGILLAMTPSILGAPPDTAPLAWALFTRQAWGCMGFGFLCTVPLLVWLGASHRWQPTRPARRFASAATAALVGMLALEVRCPAVGLMHRLVAHASLGLILGAVSLLISLFM